MLETWQSLFLILTNLVLWLPILWTLWHSHFVDATIFFLLFLASTLYHVCQSDKSMCVSTLLETQVSDHVWVMATIGALPLYTYIYIYCKFFSKKTGWLILTFWVFNQDVRFSLFLCMLFLAIINVVLVVSTFAFAIFLGWFAVLFAALRVLAFGEPLRKYDIALILITVLLLGGGFALHLIAGGVDNPNYYWAHSLWHCLAMFGLFLVVLIRDGAFIFSGWETILWHPGAKSKHPKKKNSTKSQKQYNYNYAPQQQQQQQHYHHPGNIYSVV